MREDDLKLLNVARLPGRLTGEQAAALLGFSASDLPILVKARLIRPLGNPAPNAVKVFAAVEVERLAKDEAWLARATRTLYGHWENRNKKRSDKCPASPLPVAALTPKTTTALCPASAHYN